MASANGVVVPSIPRTGTAYLDYADVAPDLPLADSEEFQFGLYSICERAFNT